MTGPALEIVSLPAFVSGIIDRADHIRCNSEALASAFADARARVLVLDGLTPIDNGAGRIARADLPVEAELSDYVLLGMEDSGPLFVRLVTGIEHGASQDATTWSRAGLITPDELSLYGTARSVIDWHARHGFCAVCGGGTEPVKAGWSRRCGGCGAEHFPRVDPAVIMLAQYRGKVLVGRQARFPAGRYSALAGFIEPGETIEQAVARELYEEAGVRAHNVRYVMSQPWPFPSSLMIGCLADAEDDRLTIDTNELEHAMWVSADDVRAAIEGREDGAFHMPPPRAVAHHLFLHWLNEQG